MSNSSLFTPALLRTHSFVFFAVHETRNILLSPFISKVSRRVSSFFLRVQLSQPYVATGHTSVKVYTVVTYRRRWVAKRQLRDESQHAAAAAAAAAADAAAAGGGDARCGLAESSRRSVSVDWSERRAAGGRVSRRDERRRLAVSAACW